MSPFTDLRLDLPIFAQGLPAFFLAGLRAVFLACLPAVFLADLRVYPPSLWQAVLGKSGCCAEKCKPIIIRDTDKTVH